MKTTTSEEYERETYTDSMACGSVLATLLLGMMSIVLLLL
jgi:hypothetical protein